MRSKTLKTLAVAGAALLLSAQGGENGGRDSERDNTQLYQIPIEDSEGRNATIHRVVVVDGERAFKVKARLGVARRNQNRVDYSIVPIFGKLSEHRYDKEDFVAAARVGEARLIDGTLALVLEPDGKRAAASIRRVAVLNKTHAFEPRSALVETTMKPEFLTSGRVIGDVFLNEDDRALALIRPFVVTDSALW